MMPHSHTDMLAYAVPKACTLPQLQLHNLISLQLLQLSTCFLLFHLCLSHYMIYDMQALYILHFQAFVSNYMA